ncbi:MAG: hypothetical protein H0W40_11385 [Methylibium sp.]|nr:hypothetical protein [Methylibium sp.]
MRAKLHEAAPAVITKLIELAKAGDLQALRLFLDRVLPALKPQAATIELPGLDRGAGLTDQGQQILAAAVNGELPPDVASELITALGRLGTLKQADELEQRLRALEADRYGDLA